MIRLAVLAAVIAAPAVAETTFGLPAGCSAYATVQKRGCVVSHLFTCQGDPEGYQRRADLTDQGLVYLGMIDAETQWIESHSVTANIIDRLAPSAPDPASFSELIETGRDSFDFMTVSDAGIVTINRGYDRLTGTSVTIDGVTLEQTEFQVVVSDGEGTELWRVEGNEFIHRDWRTFLSGVRTITEPDEVFERDSRPVDFDFPGEPGFLATQPRHDCGVMMSQAPLLDAPLIPTAFQRN